MTQRRLASGHVRDLKKRGVTFGRDGRARKAGKLLSDRALRLQITKVRAGEIATRAPRTLDVQLERWGVPKTKRGDMTPARVAKIAGVSQKKAKEWIKRDGAPQEVIDRIASSAVGARSYSSTWEHGRRSKATREEERQLRKAFHAFVRARSLNNPRAHKFYERWKRIKDYLRERLTKKAWKKLVEKLGRAEGIQKTGLFSVIRFILS